MGKKGAEGPRSDKEGGGSEWEGCAEMGVGRKRAEGVQSGGKVGGEGSRGGVDAKRCDGGGKEQKSCN